MPGGNLRNERALGDREREQLPLSLWGPRPGLGLHEAVRPGPEPSGTGSGTHSRTLPELGLGVLSSQPGVVGPGDSPLVPPRLETKACFSRG